ncbi:MAG TPA: XylR N-terminal domain-containing protein, partial [Polyangia bacterium]
MASMTAADLSLRDLLDFDVDRGGPIRFGGERVLLFDAVALGLLRRSLIDMLGLAGARAVLSRFGFAHGARTAEALRGLPWRSEADWRAAGGRLHTLQGLVTVEPIPSPPNPSPDTPFAEA